MLLLLLRTAAIVNIQLGSDGALLDSATTPSSFDLSISNINKEKGENTAKRKQTCVHTYTFKQTHKTHKKNERNCSVAEF